MAQIVVVAATVPGPPTRRRELRLDDAVAGGQPVRALDRDELAELRKLDARYADCAGETCPKKFYPAR